MNRSVTSSASTMTFQCHFPMEMGKKKSCWGLTRSLNLTHYFGWTGLLDFPIDMEPYKTTLWVLEAIEGSWTPVAFEEQRQDKQDY